MNKLKRITSMLLATIMIFGVMTVAPFTASAASYKDNFINALVNNQSSWNVPLFGDGKSMTTRIYFMDLNFDGDLELITDYNGGSGGVCVEVYGYKDGKLIHYNIDKNANLVDWFDCYYDTQENKYKVLGTDTTMFCYSSSASHKDKSNYEIVVINNTIYKDFYTCHCPIDGYYNLYRKGSPIDGYIEGAYNYNIGGPDSDSTFYNERNSERIKNCLKVNVTKKYINCSDWKNYSYTQKKKALQEAYDAFSYGVSPTSVKVNRSTLTLGVGESYGIIKTISPSNATQTCTWSSSNSSVASVNSSGKVTAKKAGTANITVKTSNGKTATCKVTVKPGPTSVKISNLGLTLGKGETFIVSQSTNSGSYAWGFSWSSSNTSVATVAKTTANKAKITAKGTGTAIITIKTYNGKTATCKVTVKSAPSSVTVEPSSVILGKGETYTIKEVTNSGTYANATNLKWSSSNTSVATVTKGSGNKAKITAKGNGTAYIKITLYNGKTAQCKVTVKNAPSSVKTNPTSVTLGVGESYTISESTNSGTYANASNLKWSSTNTNVATVTKGEGNKAKITAKGVGTAYVKITLFNGKTAQCKVTVKNAPSNIKLNKSLLVVAQGKTAIISENTPNAYANANNLVWSSADNSIVEIKKVTGTNKAEINAKKEGTTKIIVKTYNGKKAECTVQVFGTTTKTITLSFNSLDSWKNEINKKERELVFGGNYATNPSGNQYYTGNIITGKQVLEYKTITEKVSLNTPGYYQTVKYKLPSKIKYTMHKHQMEKGYGTSWYIGAGSGTVVLNNNCNCGYQDSWSWELPLEDLSGGTPPDIGNGIEIVVKPKHN